MLQLSLHFPRVLVGLYWSFGMSRILSGFLSGFLCLLKFPSSLTVSRQVSGSLRVHLGVLVFSHVSWGVFFSGLPVFLFGVRGLSRSVFIAGSFGVFLGFSRGHFGGSFGIFLGLLSRSFSEVRSLSVAVSSAS